MRFITHLPTFALALTLSWLAGCQGTSSDQRKAPLQPGKPVPGATPQPKGAPPAGNTATLPSGHCQTIGFNIVGGETCNPDAWVAHRTLFLYDDTGAEMCSGTRIGPNTVVLAAHCVLENLATVQFGYLGAKDPAPTPEDKPAAGAFRAPVDSGLKAVAWARPATFNVKKADGTTSDDDDIGLIFFSGKLDETLLNTTAIAELSEFARTTADLTTGAPAQLVTAGFGTTSDADTANDAALRAVAVNLEAIDPTTKTIQFKTGARKGTCGGDSGGPAFVLNASKTPKLVGVTSRSPDSADDDSNADTCLSGNGIDVDARYYKAWMQCVSGRVAQEMNAPALGVAGLSLGVAAQPSCDSTSTVLTYAGTVQR